MLSFVVLHALDNERMGLRRFSAYCVHILHVGRVVEGLRMFGAVESVNDETLRRCAFKGGYFAGAREVVTT